MSVGQFCNRKPITIGQHESIFNAAKLMRQYHIGCLIVVDETGDLIPIGIVTDRDLVVEVLAEEVNPNSIRVGDIMSFDLVIANENDSIEECLQYMNNRGIRRIPIVDRNGALKGLLSSDDLLEIFANQLNTLSNLINREQKYEQKKRPAV